MKTRKILATATAGLLTAGALYAGGSAKCGATMHGEGKMMKHMKRGGHLREIFKELDLTDAQKAELKALRATQKEQRAAMMMQKRERGMKIVEAIDANGFNKAKFIESARAAFESRITHRADNLEAMFKVLTPEQRAKFVTLLQNRQR